MNNVIAIPVNDTFSFPECHWFLDRNFDECLHRIGEDHVIKALRVDGRSVLVRISAETDADANVHAGALRAAILNEPLTPAIQSAVTAYIREWFDLDRDILPFYRLLQKHKPLAYMANDFRGLRLIGIPDLFEAIAWSITGQQINLKFAYRLKRRLVEAYGEAVHFGGETHYIFPEASRLAAADPEDLRAMQFSARKAEYLIIAAKAFAAGQISKEKLRQLPDLAARQKALTDIKGIGIWTANYSLMKSLQEQTSIPYGDAGLLNALLQHGVIRDKNDQASMARFFQQFPGWESYVVFYCWRSLARPAFQR